MIYHTDDFKVSTWLKYAELMAEHNKEKQAQDEKERTATHLMNNVKLCLDSFICAKFPKIVQKVNFFTDKQYYKLTFVKPIIKLSQDKTYINISFGTCNWYMPVEGLKSNFADGIDWLSLRVAKLMFNIETLSLENLYNLYSCSQNVWDGKKLKKKK